MVTKQESIIGGLGYWVGSLGSALRKGLERKLSPFGISTAQWAILEVCSRGEANTPSGLARVIPIDTAAISRHLDKLKARGLVRRRRDSRDHRSIRVELTDDGRALVPELLPYVQANNDEFLSRVTKEEQEQVTNIIQRMLGRAGAKVDSV